MAIVTLAIVSDIHYAGAAERARGEDYEYRDLSNPLLRILLRWHRQYLWQRYPLSQGRLLDQFLLGARGCYYAIANGDYSCDTSSLGVCDDAVFQSASECLSRLRAGFNDFYGTIGDHELGKLSFVGRRGGMRLESFLRAQAELKLAPVWQFRVGRYVLLGVTSSLVALPTFREEILPEELPAWNEFRAEHMRQIRSCFTAIGDKERVLLFSHDPTALPYLYQEEAVRAKLARVEQTIIGHLHSNLILRQSRMLAGMPPIRFLGNTARRMSLALREARSWRPFHVRLCPALAGIELLNDGGFYIVELDPEARTPARFVFHAVRQ